MTTNKAVFTATLVRIDDTSFEASIKSVNKEAAYKAFKRMHKGCLVRDIQIQPDFNMSQENHALLMQQMNPSNALKIEEAIVMGKSKEVFLSDQIRAILAGTKVEEEIVMAEVKTVKPGVVDVHYTDDRYATKGIPDVKKPVVTKETVVKKISDIKPVVFIHYIEGRTCGAVMVEFKNTRRVEKIKGQSIIEIVANLYATLPKLKGNSIIRKMDDARISVARKVLV